MEIGIRQTLTVVSKVDFGVYLSESSDEKDKVLLPKKQVPEGIQIGDSLEVFLYKDSKDRLIATTNKPRVTLGKVAKLKVLEVGKIGAFLDWGLEKDLLLPYREMTGKVVANDEVLVALYVDKSGRLCGTMRLYRYLEMGSGFNRGDWIEGTVYEVSDNFGAFVAIEDKYQGLIPKRECPKNIRAGQVIKARVTAVKEDGKVDLSVNDLAHIQMSVDAEKIMQRIKTDGRLSFTDKASPEIIREEMDMSKNEFKKAVGNLLKAGKIEILENAIVAK